MELPRQVRQSVAVRANRPMPEQKADLPSGLYAITPDWNGWPAGDADLLARTEALLAGGCRWLQYRDKTATPARQSRRATALNLLCQRYEARLIINDSLSLALDCGAAGVHLGAEDGDLVAARTTLGPSAILGATCYQSLTRARQAIAAGADYVAFGAVYPSPTKPAALRADLSLFQQAKALGLPACAIGGITLENAAPVVVAGARWLAVIADLYAPQATLAAITARAAAYQALFLSGSGSPAAAC